MTLRNETALPHHNETIVVRNGCADDASGAWRSFESHLNWINVSFKPDEVILRRQSFSYTQQIISMYPSAVAELDGVVIGYAASERRDLGVLEIINFYVNDEYRGMGIGTKLLDVIERQCESAGFHTIIGFASDAYYPGKKQPTNVFLRADFELRKLSRSTEMYVKQLAVETDERKSVTDTKRVIFRTTVRTERLGDDDVIIFNDLEELRPEETPEA